MHLDWRKISLILVIAISLVVAGYAGLQRYNLERDHRGIEMAVVYNELAELAAHSGMDTLDLLRDYGERGVTTVLFKEDIVEMLVNRGEFTVFKGAEAGIVFSGLLAGIDIKPAQTYLVTADKAAWQRVGQNMRAKGLPVQSIETSGLYMLSTPLSASHLNEAGLGFPLQLAGEVAGAGFNIMVQPRTWPEVKQSEIIAVFEPLSRIPRLTGILFNDRHLPGFTDPVLLGVLGHEIEKLGVPLVQIEFEEQRGFNNLALLLNKQVVRLHTIGQGEMNQYTPDTAHDRYLLAATDRNMRVLLLRPFTGPEYEDILGVNLGFAERLQASLNKKGFGLGSASLFEPLIVSRASFFIMGLGVLAGGILLARRFMPWRLCLALGVLGLAGWAGILMASNIHPTLFDSARKLASLAAVIIFPTLAVLWGVGEKRLSPGRAVLRLVQISLLSFVGAVLMVGLLADLGYMLKLDQFAGVKLAHVVPLVLLGGYFYFTASPVESPLGRIIKTLKSPVTVGLIVAGGAVAVVLLLYVMRTGNTGVGAVFPLEMQLRAFLETALVVRPRTKEFLLGYPFLLLLLYTGYRNNKYIPFLLLGTIGQVSLVNTFAHVHTPLVISLFRAVNGLWLGVLIGLVLIGLWLLGSNLIKSYGDKYGNGGAL